MNSKGQALVEYILIVALVSIIILSLVKYFGGYLKDAITKTGCNIAGVEYVAGDKAGSGTCKEDNNDIFKELDK